MTNILIVEDESNVRALIKSILESEGYKTGVASNVKEARKAIEKNNYQLVTLDIHLPGESGLDFMVELNSNFPDIAVLMVTVIDDMIVAKKTIEYGAYGYIWKPFERMELIIGVHAALHRKKLELDRKDYQMDLEAKVHWRTLELARSEERYRRVEDSMTEGIVSIDTERMITYVNHLFCKKLGYKEHEMLGHLLDEFLDKAWKQETKDQFSKKRDMIDERHESVWRTKSGKSIHAIVSPSPLFDDKGNFQGRLAVITDITELKRTEAALIKELETSTALAETASELVSSIDLVDISRKIINKAIKLTESELVMVGYLDPYTKKMIVPDLPNKIDSLYIKDEISVHEIFDNLWRKAIISKEPILTNSMELHRENSLGIADNRNIIHFLFLPAMLGDRMVGLIGLSKSNRDYCQEDIKFTKFLSDLYAISLVRKWHEDEIKNREKMLRDILNSIAAGIMIVDRKTFLISEINPTAAKIIGTPPEKIIGNYCWNILPPPEKGQCPLRKGNVETESSEHILINAHGQEIPIFRTVVPINFRGRPHFLETFINITQQKKMEFQLAQAQKLESIGQLAAGIAHEINTPTQYVGDNTRFLKEVFTDLLNMFDLYDQLLIKAKKNFPNDHVVRLIEETVEKYDLPFLKKDIPISIDQTLEGVDRIATIVQSMRQFAHSDRGKKSPTDLHKMIESTAIVSHNKYKFVADIKFDFDPTLPLVPCLAGEFNQAILNLILNATYTIAEKYEDIDDKKGLITISTKNMGKWAEIKIADTGQGIPKELIPKIFDPFFTTKEVGKGTGQGLAIVHAVIVEKHGGTIEVDSKERQGSTFTIRLPLKDNTKN